MLCSWCVAKLKLRKAAVHKKAHSIRSDLKLKLFASPVLTPLLLRSWGHKFPTGEPKYDLTASNHVLYLNKRLSTVL